METNSHTQTYGFKLKGNWEVMKLNLRKHFPLLTDEDLHWDTGKDNELVERLCVTLNRKPHEIVNLLNRYQIGFFVPNTM